jgi:hypothetical protein
MRARIQEAIVDDQMKFLIVVMAVQKEFLQMVNMSLPKCDIHFLFGLEALPIPITREQMFAREHAANLRMREVASFERSSGH